MSANNSNIKSPAKYADYLSKFADCIRKGDAKGCSFYKLHINLYELYLQEGQ